ncbi:hypothetical protein [Pseudactinotalea sp.]
MVATLAPRCSTAPADDADSWPDEAMRQWAEDEAALMALYLTDDD